MSSQDPNEEEEDETQVWLCLHFSTPSPLIYIIEGSQGVFCREDELKPTQTNPVHQWGKLHLEGQRQWRHGLVGRRPVGPNQPLLWARGTRMPSCPKQMSWPFVLSVSCSGGPFDPCDDTCRALVRRNFKPWIMPHHLVANLANKHHMHTFSNQHQWNSLIFNPMLAFIPWYVWILYRILQSQWVKIDPQQVLGRYTTDPERIWGYSILWLDAYIIFSLTKTWLFFMDSLIFFKD